MCKFIISNHIQGKEFTKGKGKKNLEEFSFCRCSIPRSGMSNMDLGFARPGGSGDRQEASSSNKKKRSRKRHTEEQIKVLESFFKMCPHPDKDQQFELSRIVGLQPHQIKFWFQNKRTHTKAQMDRSSNDGLRVANENINTENLAIKEVLKNVKCKSCAGAVCVEDIDEQILQNLQLENAQLKEEYDKVCNLLSTYSGKPIPELVALASTLGSTLDLLPGFSSNDEIGSSSHDPNFDSGPANCYCYNIFLHYCVNGITSTERAVMLQTATSAIKELVRLLRDDVLWVKSAVDGRLVVRRDIYEEMFPSTNYHLRSSTAIESSKDSRMVIMNPMQMVDMFLDSDKWVDLFPTIVTKAKTIQVLRSGFPENRDGALQLMHAQTHILSPLVPPREFLFLRHCQKIESGKWVIMDVSIDELRENFATHTRCWKLPSGCMIQEMPNGTSMITWVEHVEVDEKTQTHSLYGDLLGSSLAYGAERWATTLERMCERFEYSFRERITSKEALGVVRLPEGRSSIVKLANRMVKNFFEMLNMSGKPDCPNSEVKSRGVQVSICRNTQPGKPGGVVVSMATSLWLPLPFQSVFDFLKDEKKRAQWDVLCNGNRPHEITHISNGAHPGNFTSIIQPFNLSEIKLLILQETCIDPLGSVVTYAPIDMSALNVVMCGNDCSEVPILASGFLISKNGQPKPNKVGEASSSRIDVGGSVLTAAYQILISTSLSAAELNMDLVAAVNGLLCSTVQKIRVALDCAGLNY